MKYLVKFFVVTFLLLIYTNASAEQQIVYLDMKFILNNSKAGKGAQDFLQNSLKRSNKEFADRESELKKREGDLLAKKSTLTKEEYQKKTDELRKKVIDYQSARRLSLEKIANQRADSRKKLLTKIDPILNDYIKENIHGMFFNDQTAESLTSIIEKFEKKVDCFDSKKIQKSISNFTFNNFLLEYNKVVNSYEIN